MKKAIEEFMWEKGVKQCPPALAAGGQHSPLTRKQVMLERREFRIGGKISNYLGIKKVALEIAYDNGFIHRNVPEVQWLSSLDPIINELPVEKLVALNAFCLTLNDEDVNILAAGEETEMKFVEGRFDDSDFCHNVFHYIFEGGINE